MSAELDLAPIKARHEATIYNATLNIASAHRVAQHSADDVPALLAEVERLRRGGRTLGQIIDRAHQDVLDATQMHHVIDEDGDGDWALVWERLHELCRIGRNYQEAVRGL